MRSFLDIPIATLGLEEDETVAKKSDLNLPPPTPPPGSSKRPYWIDRFKKKIQSAETSAERIEAIFEYAEASESLFLKNFSSLPSDPNRLKNFKEKIQTAGTSVDRINEAIFEYTEVNESNLLDLENFNSERHVLAAFSIANVLAGKRSISAADLLRSAILVQQKKDMRSSAFSYLVSLLPLDNLPEVSAAIKPDLKLSLSPGLADNYPVAREFFLTYSNIWGRDYVTFALLAINDPSLNEIAIEASTTVGQLQAAWFEFVTSTDQHRKRDEWARWWKEAGVSVSAKRAGITGATYLFTWNPNRFPGARIKKYAEEITNVGPSIMKWSTGNRRHVSRGDRVFLMRQGAEPRGLVGSGQIEGEIEETEHWDPKKRDEGKKSWIVPVRWEKLSATPLVTYEALVEETGEDRLWRAQSGGVKIESSLAATLEDLMSRAADMPTPNKILRFAKTLSDLDHSLDWIGIRRDVEALSTLTAVNRIEPPLSIAICGDWGAGKTFLMRKIQERVKLLEQVGKAQESANGGKDAARFCSSILQIEYNAWHYIESNLWASLVNHLFEKLNRKLAPEDKGQKQADLVQRFFAKLETARAAREAAEQQIELVTAEVKQGQTAYKESYEEAETARSDLARAIGRNVWSYLGDRLKEPGSERTNLENALEHFGYGKTLGSAQMVYDVLTRFRSVSGRAKELFSSLLSTREGVIGAIVVAVSVVAATAVAIKYKAPILSVGTMFVGTLTWLAERMGRARKWLVAVQSADSWYSNLKQEEESRIASEIANARAKFEQQKDALSAARRQLGEAQTREARAKADLAKLTARDQMRRFVDERVTARTYAKHLGLISMIRRDFEDLSDYMLQDRQPGQARLVREVEAEIQQAIPKVERIVLYIDDLDRCQPERVVEVLEAVHMLLAFRLFIVVVAVDPRWVIQSLRLRYPHLTKSQTPPAAGRSSERPNGTGSTNRAEATAHDYLEKIFHIPFWVKPMGPDACKSLIAGYLNFSNSDDGQSDHSEEPEAKRFHEIGPDRSARQSTITESPLFDPSEIDTKEDQAAVVGKQSREAAARLANERAAAERKIEHVEITANEQKLIQQLAPHLGHSPRRIKRYANTYRLMKSGLTGQEARIFSAGVAGGNDFRIVLVFLAIVTGAPTLAPQILAKAFELRTKFNVQTLIKKTGLNDPTRESYEATSAKGALELLGNARIAAEEIETWLPRVMRYAFRLAPVDLTEVGRRRKSPPAKT